MSPLPSLVIGVFEKLPGLCPCLSFLPSSTVRGTVVLHALTTAPSTSWQYYDQDPVELVEDVKEEIKSEGRKESGKEKNEL